MSEAQRAKIFQSVRRNLTGYAETVFVLFLYLYLCYYLRDWPCQKGVRLRFPLFIK